MPSNLPSTVGMNSRMREFLATYGHNDSKNAGSPHDSVRTGPSARSEAPARPGASDHSDSPARARSSARLDSPAYPGAPNRPDSFHDHFAERNDDTLLSPSKAEDNDTLLSPSKAEDNDTLLSPFEEACDSSFSWEVVLPERSQAARARRGSAKKPHASIRISDARGSDYQSVPVPVARALKRARKAGEMDPHTREELAGAIAEHTTIAAHTRVGELASRRDYAASEVREKLAADGFSPDAVREAIRWATDAGVISNARFADAFIRSKIAAGWGMARIERELARRGIEAGEVDGWPYDYLNPDDELERALELASRKTVREPHAREKLARFLVGRGFSYGVALEAAHRTLD